MTAHDTVPTAISIADTIAHFRPMLTIDDLAPLLSFSPKTLYKRERTLALLDAATGLRVSELLALRWSDVDFENLELNVTRSIWHQVTSLPISKLYVKQQAFLCRV